MAKADVERKIVAGEFVLSLLDSGEYDRQRFMSRLDTYLRDNRGRALPACPHATKRRRRHPQDVGNVPFFSGGESGSPTYRSSR